MAAQAAAQPHRPLMCLAASATPLLSAALRAFVDDVREAPLLAYSGGAFAVPGAKNVVAKYKNFITVDVAANGDV